MTDVDQVTLRRAGRVGLTAHDPARTCPGYLLYAPMYGDGDVYLLDMEGGIAHQWSMPYGPGLWGYLLDNGNLFYNGKVKDDGSWDRFFQWNNFKAGALFEADWDGNVLWEHRDNDHHHDGRRTASGGAIYLAVEPVEPALAARVRGGQPGTDHDVMWADVIREVDATGDPVWEWHAVHHLDPVADRITFNDFRHEWSHGNTIVPLDDDRVLASFRNISTIAIIDKASGDFVWKLGPPQLAQQHDPSLLENGNILVYDNGAYRPDIPLPFSRALEINPGDNRVVWSYVDATPASFFSPYISGARRLPNGNTLLTEGNFGRMFQVTPDHQVVWEYINPHFPTDTRGRPNNAVFRASHYLPDQIPHV